MILAPPMIRAIVTVSVVMSVFQTARTDSIDMTNCSFERLTGTTSGKCFENQATRNWGLVMMQKSLKMAHNMAAGTLGTLCNHRLDLCNLRFDQVTLLGSHNAGSYGYSALTKCVYANHNVNEIGQLDRGARFLDMDVCLRDDVVRTCHGKGAIARVMRPLEEALHDVQQWALAHPNEVFMISFGDSDPTDAVSKARTAILIAGLLDKYFAKPGMAMQSNDLTETAGGQKVWPTLGAMISSGRRVVLAFEGDSLKPKNDLFVDAPPSSHDFITNLASGFRYTYGQSNKASYTTLLNHIEDYCSSGNVTELAIHLDVFMKPFVPRGHVSDTDTDMSLSQQLEKDEKGCFCNECTAEQLNLAASKPGESSDDVSGKSVLERSHQTCSQQGRHVHVVKIDFEEYGDVEKVVWRLNDENVKRYCSECVVDPAPSETTTATTTSQGSSSGWWWR
eukprot:gnl/MRDRNA2_/MRDRNA2_104146_c0_seq1.p1 gnl/MRDRNA2_/MRDRNA2_104146_c0~~gnl/MRDRNA2_/MRDRNA2_104146_c0_seq1.p1  ORF type:complete len:449 (+),score=73.25 gnl/MRDRNA2_/MRDRNA2_104146_c0_seq1:88-1434(+)